MDKENVAISIYKNVAVNARVGGLIEGFALGLLFTYSLYIYLTPQLLSSRYFIVAVLTFAICLTCDYSYKLLGKEVNKWQ